MSGNLPFFTYQTYSTARKSLVPFLAVHIIYIIFIRDSHCVTILQITIQKNSAAAAAAYRIVIALFSLSDGKHACD